MKPGLHRIEIELALLPDNRLRISAIEPDRRWAKSVETPVPLTGETLPNAMALIFSAWQAEGVDPLMPMNPVGSAELQRDMAQKKGPVAVDDGPGGVSDAGQP